MDTSGDSPNSFLDIVVKLSLILTLGCTDYSALVPEEHDKLYTKLIQTSSVKVESYFHSNYSNVSPYYVVITSGRFTDTICVLDNLKDVHLGVDSSYILICAYGFPSINGKRVSIDHEVMDYSIQIDSNYVRNNNDRSSYFKVK